MDDEYTPKLKLKPDPLIELEPNRIKNMISAIEENVKLNEADPNESEKGKNAVENAFTRLMNSNGGENTPSPGRKRMKRLTKVKPHGMKRLDDWLRKEKQ